MHQSLADDPRVGLAVFVAISALCGVLLGRFVRPWLLGGILAGPLAIVSLLVIDTVEKGHVDKFALIAFVVGLGASFLLTLPCSFLGYLWRTNPWVRLTRSRVLTVSFAVIATIGVVVASLIWFFR